MKHNTSAWPTHPDYKIKIETLNKHVSIVVKNIIVADSYKAFLLFEQDHSPVYYFTRQDVRMDFFHKISTTTFCPFKGEASHFALSIHDIHIKTAAWSYENPFEQVSEIKNAIAFYPEVLDHIIID